MIRWVLRRVIDKVEREWNDDASYLRDIIDATPRAAWMVLRATDLLAAAVVGGSGWPHLRPHGPRSSRPPSVFIL
jgi:hypothetical protein